MDGNDDDDDDDDDEGIGHCNILHQQRNKGRNKTRTQPVDDNNMLTLSQHKSKSTIHRATTRYGTGQPS
ncbi:hypothetical protein PoB_001388500 [Plakobranchus ocellatus]|uniref:Uncharacterized protein n=1 Tax=Plakobranchus ocellatus TaxID=259542 RepID=A0AAV3YVY2_9GAST|nr:hypothetical protein PoB_001388500 [Plakobranchus ocellatus]